MLSKNCTFVKELKIMIELFVFVFIRLASSLDVTDIIKQNEIRVYNFDYALSIFKFMMYIHALLQNYLFRGITSRTL